LGFPDIARTQRPDFADGFLKVWSGIGKSFSPLRPSQDSTLETPGQIGRGFYFHWNTLMPNNIRSILYLDIFPEKD
jgi:hypothetical protein